MVVIRKEYLTKNRPNKLNINELSGKVIKSGSGIQKQAQGSQNSANNKGGGSSFVNVILDKKKGQHLLKNTGILDKIISAADIKPTDTVLEIGPGTGNLTMRLLPLARKVVAFDIDPRMVAEVKKRSVNSGFSNLEVKEGDALRSSLGDFDVCTANLPYQISSPFVFRLLSLQNKYRCAVLMFQEEFALRLLAEPGEKHYCRLSVNTKLFSKVTRVCKVAPGSFNPPPKVNSMVVKLEPKKIPVSVNFREWDGLMRICFSRKKKTIRANFNNTTTLNILENNYKVWCSIHKKNPSGNLPFKAFVFKILEDSGLSSKRGFTVDINEYFRLLFELNKNGIHFVNIIKGNAINDNSDNFDFLFSNADSDMDENMEGNHSSEDEFKMDD
ncbi:Dim1p-like ErmB KsgA methylase [Cryptosporidium ubiquitum]|uniref:rRNA adenine N(6)-methyltransferase n=1 Tax=Cryptosporidium ubiquitum TaxID=857276 RepID=A0A1J4MIY0_9CRYT|nr:Dim1p-like ErmB KsgA methylase [Cryptosporidium ubiquitum]OII72988.1 Dim1p-like ErmB KsgA methylase [Cryptosporidium ubiquitum]